MWEYIPAESLQIKLIFYHYAAQYNEFGCRIAQQVNSQYLIMLVYQYLHHAVHTLILCHKPARISHRELYRPISNALLLQHLLGFSH